MEDQYKKALQLQRQRSALYYNWEEHLHRVVMGKSTASQLHQRLEVDIFPRFQAVSSELRTQQAALRESMADEVAMSPYLIQWTDEIQRLEKHHYELFIVVSALLLAHCQPNIISNDAIAAAAVSTKEGESHKKEAESSSAPSSVADAADTVETTSGAETAPVQDDSSPPQQPAVLQDVIPTIRVHDIHRCFLMKALPPRCHAQLHFVSCRGAIDDLAEENHEGIRESDELAWQRIMEECVEGKALESGHGTEEEDRENAQEEEEEEILYGQAKYNGSAAAIASYRPRDVALRCVLWSRKASVLLKRREALRSAIEARCDDLQSEISDM